MRGVSLIVCALNILLCGVAGRTIYSYLELSPPTPEVVAFLKRYGYLAEDAAGLAGAYTPQSLSDPLKTMQAFAGLPETGTLDQETIKLMNSKRCGVKDIDSTFAFSRRRRYVLQQGWTKRSITFRVVNGTSTLDKARIEELMSTGLALWAPYGGLHFHKIDTGRADIQVSFVSGDHGDGFPFDGIGRVVAHAFPPPHGAMHFDNDEVWGDNPEEDSEDSTDFFAVAVHEIGHALGLSHSNDKGSVMYPYYQLPVEKLHMDDILGMQELYYTSPEEPVEVTESVSYASSVPRFTKADSEELDENYIPDLCMTNYDTVQVIHGKIYVFEEEWVWVLRDRNELESGYPRRFHELFVGLPADVTIIKTIYERHNGNVVIFSDRNYWEFDQSFRLIKKSGIADYLIPPGVSLTTVFISNYNNKTYLIEEERYWRFDEATWTMDKGYPKEMSAWRKVPYPVDAAIIWKGGECVRSLTLRRLFVWSRFVIVVTDLAISEENGMHRASYQVFLLLTFPSIVGSYDTLRVEWGFLSNSNKKPPDPGRASSVCFHI